MYESILRERLNNNDLTKEQLETRGKFLDEIENAIDKYGDNHIDIGVDRSENKIHGYFHSNHDSFHVTKDYPADIMTDKDLDDFCGGSAMCWDNIAY